MFMNYFSICIVEASTKDLIKKLYFKVLFETEKDSK